MDRVYEGRVFAVEVGRRRFPNGAEHQVALVRHRPSVVILPMLDDGRILLIRQYRPSVDRMMWELPAGSIDPSEPLEEAAVRECAEETRLIPKKVERLAALYPAPGFCDELLVFFRATSFSPAEPGSPFQADDDEDIETRPVTLEEARRMVASGEIEDMKTAYGLTLVG
jgi:ADP-ribose pyrophosphatase